MGPEGSPWNSTVRASVGRLGTSIADGRRGLRSGRARTAHFPREVGEDGFAGVLEPARSDGRSHVADEAAGVGGEARRRAALVDPVLNRSQRRFGTLTLAAGSLAWTARAVRAAAFAVRSGGPSSAVRSVARPLAGIPSDPS